MMSYKRKHRNVKAKVKRLKAQKWKAQRSQGQSENDRLLGQKSKGLSKND